MNSIQVRIQGREYTLRSSQSPEQVQQVADFVEEKLAETAAGRAVDTRDLTVLTLLNLAGQFLQLRHDKALEEGQVEQRLGQVVERLEKADFGND